ncbi:hypothetical protein LWI28_009822 [Acer negundo]|uniref:Retrotransposon gag domain-containing protein n=1 Tax=Acer negundo TaxID=4023 RepID=A0AAD5JJV7_ACENE|nr:hypothetical protein LWI28_009822 [Acer negundo]
MRKDMVTLERFKKLGPPVFKGKANPIAAEAWLKQIEKVFTAIVCSDEQKVVFASFMLEDEAGHWDFINLKQGSKPIAGYEEQFTSLSRFVTKLIPDDESKGRSILDDFHLNIQSREEVLKLTRYTDIVD